MEPVDMTLIRLQSEKILNAGLEIIEILNTLPGWVREAVLMGIVQGIRPPTTEDR